MLLVRPRGASGISTKHTENTQGIFRIVRLQGISNLLLIYFHGVRRKNLRWDYGTVEKKRSVFMSEGLPRNIGETSTAFVPKKVLLF